MAALTQIGHFLKILYSSIKAFTLFILFIPVLTKAQTNISGIVNTYHPVTEVVYADACVRLSDVTGLSSGDMVLLIQMKGASVNTANSSTFGDTTSLNDAGNYEVGFICKVSNDSVFLVHSILNSYSVTNKVQLVKFAEYISANVVDTIKAAMWDNSTGTGGVIAISVDQTLTLNAPVSADSAGYEGGAFKLSSSTCTSSINGYAYNGNNATQNGAFKGEGVADVAAGVSGGRGAPANGGGGGNNHNNGGGGGANLVAGGAGGGNYTTVSGACTGNFKGQGGKALSSHGGTKLFMGGGGGAGHVNNNPPAYGGGNGGGIIIIFSKDIIGNGYKISANGRAGAGSGSDGASGGGAGGSVIMNVINSYSGSLLIEANGGNGGTANNQNIVNRCYGAGGGGSGGVIYFNGPLPAVTTYVNGGAAGADVGVSGCGTPVPAAAGTAGSVNTGYNYRSSTTLSTVCDLALPVQLLQFTATFISRNVQLNWEISSSSNARWFEVEKQAGNNQWATIHQTLYNGSYTYQFTDNQPQEGINYYRLKITDQNNRITYSVTRKIRIDKNVKFDLFPNPADNYVKISGPLKAGMILSVSDISGKLIKRIVITSDNSLYHLPIAYLAKGVYMLQVGDSIIKLVKK